MQSQPQREKSKPVSKPAPGLTRLPAGLKVQTHVKAGPTCGGAGCNKHT
jgi:hypothetical protein